MSDMTVMDSQDFQEKVRDVYQGHEQLKKEIGKVIIGQEEVIDLMLISVFTSSHSLLMGVPGLAKTLLVHTLADATSLRFTRVQFTPDMMPSDLIGTEVLQEDKTTGSRHFKFLQGPLFTNLLLADEINRTTPKTQAALLQCMQERNVSIGGKTHELEPPFLVFATQNPIEQEGTYPLPEAQLDRFLFRIDVKYPAHREEIDMASNENANNVLRNAPHTLAMVTNDTWDFPYSRQKAAFPLAYISENKFWPSVRRVDDAYGDRNLICTCAPIEAYAEAE